jgi:uncharacterized protein DUF2752
MRRAAAAGAAAASTMLVLASPLKLCLVATVFHRPCPGCGLTRAAVAMLRGDFGRAFALHPLSLALVPLIAWMIAAHVMRYLRTGTPWKRDRIPRWAESVAAGVALLLVGVWVARFFGYCGGPVSV